MSTSPLPISLRQIPHQFVKGVRRMLRPMPSDYQKRFAMTIHEWLRYHQQELVFEKSFWMGIPLLKNPCDLWIYQQLLFQVRPDVLIEIGSCKGGSTLYFAHLFDLLAAHHQLEGKVISIDIDRSDYRVSHPRIVELTGSSSSDEIIAQVQELCAGKRVLVIHDGDHTKKQVLKDLACYAPLVSVGSYLIVEDGIIDLFRPKDSLGSFEAGPLAALREFLPAHPEFEIDKECERYIITHNPDGFLKRVK